MALPLVGDTPAYWYMARAGGIVAYLLLFLATFWGVAMSGKMTKGSLKPALLYGLHEFFPFLAMIFAVIHAASLLGDQYIGFRPVDLLLPFIRFLCTTLDRARHRGYLSAGCADCQFLRAQTNRSSRLARLSLSCLCGVCVWRWSTGSWQAVIAICPPFAPCICSPVHSSFSPRAFEFWHTHPVIEKHGSAANNPHSGARFEQKG